MLQERQRLETMAAGSSPGNRVDEGCDAPADLRVANATEGTVQFQSFLARQERDEIVEFADSHPLETHHWAFRLTTEESHRDTKGSSQASEPPGTQSDRAPFVFLQQLRRHADATCELALGQSQRAALLPNSGADQKVLGTRFSRSSVQGRPTEGRGGNARSPNLANERQFRVTALTYYS